MSLLRLAPLMSGALLLPLAAPAAAQALRTPVHGGDVMYDTRGVDLPTAVTSASHLIYLNNCLPDGCTVHPGFDDSRSDTSSIPWQTSHLDGYPWGTDSWDELVQRVRDIYSPFDVTITTTDPGDADHFEVMVGGSSTDIGVNGAGGVAPFISCAVSPPDNVISFVFAETSSNINYLSGAVAQETAHVFGLDHELDASDAMTYLELGSAKHFTTGAAPCGEELANPRQCWCGDDTQDSYQFLMDMFGPQIPTAPTVTITEPVEGAWVHPGFVVRATIESQSTATTVIDVNGQPGAVGGTTSIIGNAPDDLPDGEHELVVTSTNASGLSGSATITVNVTGACEPGSDTCGDGLVCLGGYCTPGADLTGGLGAPCTTREECIIGTCASVGETQLCTAACDEGGVCPDGYTCRSAGSTSVCWLGGDDGGGCQSSDGGGGALLGGLGLVGLVLASRRRRRTA